MITIGIDNGVSGTLAAFKGDKLIDFKESFTKKWLKPTVKTKASYMTRIDVPALMDWLRNVIKENDNVRIIIERYMTDQRRLHATLSSHHAQEATMIAIELLGIPYMTIDSSVWQKREIPGVKGSEFLKLASKEKCVAEFPKFKKLIEKHGDGDAILIAKTFINNPELFVDDYARIPKKPDKKFKKKFKTNFIQEKTL